MLKISLIITLCGMFLIVFLLTRSPIEFKENLSDKTRVFIEGDIKEERYSKGKYYFELGEATVVCSCPFREYSRIWAEGIIERYGGKTYIKAHRIKVVE